MSERKILLTVSVVVTIGVFVADVVMAQEAIYEATNNLALVFGVCSFFAALKSTGS